MSQVVLEPTKTEPETTPGPVNKGKNERAAETHPLLGMATQSEEEEEVATSTLEKEKGDAFLNYLTLNESRYPSQAEKVALFLRFMQGPIAGKWATRRIEELVNDADDNDIPEGQEHWRTLRSLHARFMQDFGPLDPKVSAQLKIDNLSMTGDLAKLDDYITAFDEWSGATKHNDAALITFFKKGLPNALTERVDTTAAEEKASCKKVMATTTTTTTASVPVRGASTNAACPANNRRASTAPLKKLTPEERQHCMDNNLCFKCRLPGHQTFECPMNAPAMSTTTTTCQFSSNNTFRPAIRSTTDHNNNSSASASSSSSSSTVPPPDFTSLPEDAIQAFFTQKDF
ncbi:hypothetical protein V5O48_003889 [Marasmius crinis-equi]|uniref:CCHC-type domain-containing protein n=1 Tax=Marasmius crinis-equi TaxID=585013 RepID=A0ABR3FS50_9AGAR